MAREATQNAIFDFNKILVREAGENKNFRGCSGHESPSGLT